MGTITASTGSNTISFGQDSDPITTVRAEAGNQAYVIDYSNDSDLDRELRISDFNGDSDVLNFGDFPVTIDGLRITGTNFGYRFSDEDIVSESGISILKKGNGNPHIETIVIDGKSFDISSASNAREIVDLIEDEGSVSPEPEIDVQGRNGAAIADGDLSPAGANGTNFGSTEAAGDSTIEQRFTIRNTGDGALDLTGDRVTIAGVNAGDFSISDAPPASIAAGGSAEFRVTFDPSAAGARNAVINILNNDSDEAPYNFAISGQGTAPVAPPVLSPEIDVRGSNGAVIADGDLSANFENRTTFGSVNVDGDDTNARGFTIANTGDGGLDLTGDRITLTGDHADDFSLTQLPPASIAAGASAIFQITFNPSAAGTRSAVVNILSNDSDEATYNFAISGRGTEVVAPPVLSPEIDVRGSNGNAITDGDLSPSSSNRTVFGATEVDGGDRLEQRFTIRNTGDGPLDLTGDRVTISGANAGDFRISQTPPTSIAAGGSAEFRISFDPSAAGTRSAVVSILNNDGNESPYNFAISGEGTAPAEPPAPIFDSVILSNDEPLEVTNPFTDPRDDQIYTLEPSENLLIRSNSSSRGSDLYQVGTDRGGRITIEDKGRSTDIDVLSIVNLSTGVADFSLQKSANDLLIVGDRGEVLLVDQFDRQDGMEELALGAFRTDQPAISIDIADADNASDVADAISSVIGFRPNVVGEATIVGTSGDDVVPGTDSADTLQGGEGDDRYTINDAGDIVVETAGGGFDRITLVVDLGNFQVPDHVEQLVLETGVIAATPASTGTKLAGLADNNIFFSGPGTDFYDGNDGRDTLSYANATAGVEASFLKPTAFNTGGAGTDKIDDMEILIGSEFDDVLVGGQGVPNDIFGGRGDDVIVGFAGPDRLTGGAGRDTFLYNRLDFRDSLADGGEDTILDFTPGSDTLDLSRLQIDASDITRLTGRLEADVTGDGSPDFAINFTGGVVPNLDDIIV